MSDSSNLSAIIPCYIPSLNELQTIIQKALKDNFVNVNVDISPCPDTSQSPFDMTSSGFGKNMRIAEVGGPGNLFPLLHKEKHFDFKEICKTCELPSAGLFGPGAGPWPIVGKNCEMVADANLAKQKFATKIGKLLEGDEVYEMNIIDSNKFSLMANLAVFESDHTVDTIHFVCSQRTGKLNLPETIRQGLSEYYGEKPVSMGGIFILKKGEAKMHVMPHFPVCPWKENKEIDSWLKYFTMRSPLICTSIIHSFDPGYKLRMEHTHAYSQHGDAGHYHYDTTPDIVEYEGWFAVANSIYRIDQI